MSTPDTPTPEQPCGAPGDEEQLRPAITLPLTFPAGLHPDTTSLVLRFATALAKKFRKAEEKYMVTPTDGLRRSGSRQESVPKS